MEWKPSKSLRERVVELSLCKVSPRVAFTEWVCVEGVELEPPITAACICGVTLSRMMFIYRHNTSGIMIYVGSTCKEHFEQA